MLQLQKEQPHRLVLWAYTDDKAGLAPSAAPVTPEFYGREQMGRLFLDGFLYYVWNKLFRLDLVRTESLAFQTDLRYGEDLTFCMEYIRRWFATPGSEGVAFCRAPLYYYETGNEASITYLYKPCYCEDEVRLTGRLMGWFSEDFPLQAPERAPFFIHLLRTIAGGLSVDLAQPDGYALARRHLTCPTVQTLLAQAAGINAYTPFLLPMRRGWVRLSALLGHWRLSGSRWYHRVYWAGYRLHSLRTGKKSPVIL